MCRAFTMFSSTNKIYHEVTMGNYAAFALCHNILHRAQAYRNNSLAIMHSIFNTNVLPEYDIIVSYILDGLWVFCAKYKFNEPFSIAKSVRTPVHHHQ